MNIRKLLPTDIGELRDHLLRLTPADRVRRFMGTVDDSQVSKHCEQLDARRSIVLGHFSAGVLRGAAELQLIEAQTPMPCELAITVETPWQDHGVGTELLRRGLVLARNRGARGVQLNCFGDNYRIQHIVQKLGVHVRHEMGASEAEIPTAAPTYWSLYEELIDDGVGWLSLWSDVVSGTRPIASDRSSATRSTGFTR